MKKEFINKINSILQRIEKSDEYCSPSLNGKPFNFHDLKNNQCLFRIEDKRLSKIELSTSNPDYYFGFSDRNSQRLTYYYSGKLIFEVITKCDKTIIVYINEEEVLNEKSGKNLTENEKSELLGSINSIVSKIESNLMMFYMIDEDEEDIPGYYD